jgi:NADH-quinone oxidoreductase subunit L
MSAMLVPLYDLAVGARAPCLTSMFFGHDEHIAHFFEGLDLHRGSENQDPRRDPSTCRAWVKWSPTCDGARLRRSPGTCTSARPTPKRSPSSNPGLYQFLLNKWYFDELYDRIFVKPAKWLGRFLWKLGDGWLVDGFGPEGVGAGCSRRHLTGVVKAADRLSSTTMLSPC